MRTPIDREFWTRRWARDDWLGLHLTLGIATCLALVGLFGLLSLEVRGSEPPAIDQRIYEQLREHRESSPATRSLFLHVTDIGTWNYVAPVVVCGAAMLVWRRHYFLAITWVLVIATAPLVNSEVKGVFHRARPSGIDPRAPEASYSFPSGHSMQSMIAYGMTAYLLLITLPRRWPRRAGVAVLALLVLAVGFSRTYLSAHWFTDVLGGFTLGSAWSAFWIAVLECGRRRSLNRRLLALDAVTNGA